MVAKFNGKGSLSLGWT